MKIFVAALALLAITTFANAAVVSLVSGDENDKQIGLEDVDADGGITNAPDTPVVRDRRLTCDLFSFKSKIVTPNHAACAAKCIGKGKKGGSCQGTKCVCRNDKWVG